MANVLKVNLKGSGYEHVWSTSYPLVQGTRIDDILAIASQDGTGPSLAYRCECLGPCRFLLSVASIWAVPDEFGRSGISLTDGRLIDIDPCQGDRVHVLVREFFSAVAAHSEYYEWIGGNVAALSREADMSRVAELQTKLYQLRVPVDRYTYQFVDHVGRLLLAQLNRGQSRLCLCLEYPWDEHLAFACLLGTLALCGTRGGAHGGTSRHDGGAVLSTRLEHGFSQISMSSLPVGASGDLLQSARRAEPTETMRFHAPKKGLLGRLLSPNKPA